MLLSRVFQADEWNETEEGNVCNEENIAVMDAYRDHHLQPVVAISRLTQEQYVDIAWFEEIILP